MIKSTDQQSSKQIFLSSESLLDNKGIYLEGSIKNSPTYLCDAYEEHYIYLPIQFLIETVFLAILDSNGNKAQLKNFFFFC